jgi:hypothetical protein
MTIACDAIFPGEACATLFEYINGLSERGEHIIYAHALTLEVAFYVLNHPVIGIITEESSFATHGANILRSYSMKTGKYIVWVSGVSYSLINGVFGDKIKIDINYIIHAFCNTECMNGKKYYLAKSGQVRYLPLRKKSILEYNTSDKSHTVCYWPHRQFNILTFSIMCKGLSKNFDLFGVEINGIVLDKTGKIWFANAPLIFDLRKWALDFDFATPILNKQIEMYNIIFEKLHDSYTFRNLVEYLIDYFSVFLLFHDTYEDVLVNAHSFFLKKLGNDTAVQMMDTLMFCKLDEWILEKNLILVKRKDLLSDEPKTPLPNFSIMDDINITTKRIKQYLVEKGENELYDNNIQIFEFYIKFFIAKEWKFIMNKILFTRFSDWLKNKLFENKLEFISKTSIDIIIDLVEEQNI